MDQIHKGIKTVVKIGINVFNLINVDADLLGKIEGAMTTEVIQNGFCLFIGILIVGLKCFCPIVNGAIQGNKLLLFDVFFSLSFL